MATSTRPGDLLAGRYRLIDLLSESGGGRFWRAHDNVLERYVALHVIAEDDPRAPGLLAAARASATVLDPRILRVLDAEATQGRCYVVNEWGTGTSLDILVTHLGPLGPRRSSWLAAEVAGAVAVAHRHGVAHGRLNPENVLIDHTGGIRLIGFSVDAALHGLPPADPEHDRQDLGGLLYCALTATWPGPSASAVPGAPHEHTAVLSPRRVRAGVPRPLDLLWSAIVDGDQPRRRWQTHPDLAVGTAEDVRERLLEFLGDPTGLPEALAASLPPINEVQQVSLPSVPDLLPHDLAPPPEADPGPGPDAGPETGPETGPDNGPDESRDPEQPADDPPIPSAAEIAELPTEAGMPVWDDNDDDVAWLRRRTPPPPPPPFEDPPERPLFAPEPADGTPPRQPSEHQPSADQPVAPVPLGDAPLAAAGFWPWDTGGPDSALERTTETEVVPGRNWLRLAMVLAAVVVLLVAVVIAFNLGRGRTPLGNEREPSGSDLTTPAEPSASPLPQVTASAFDPLGTDDGFENSDDAGLAVDGDPATGWATQTYNDQLGPPPGLKTGVGLLLDLGAQHEIAAVDLTLAAAPADVQLFVSDAAPTTAPDGEPAAEGSAAETELSLEPAGDDPDRRVTGRYLLVWFTSLPSVGDGFRGELTEVVVRGR